MDLKPCPFCGNSRIELEGTCGYHLNQYPDNIAIKCYKCRTIKEFSICYTLYLGELETEEYREARKRAEQKAIEWWNTRSS